MYIIYLPTYLYRHVTHFLYLYVYLYLYLHAFVSYCVGSFLSCSVLHYRACMHLFLFPFLCFEDSLDSRVGRIESNRIHSRNRYGSRKDAIMQKMKPQSQCYSVLELQSQTHYISSVNLECAANRPVYWMLLGLRFLRLNIRPSLPLLQS